MHMADALITPQVGAVMFAATTGVTAYSINKIRKQQDFQSKIPLMGVVGAFVFAAQMVNFSIPGTGSSGHVAGAVLLSALLGPEAAFISMMSILTIQCLFFADGGLLALGCNIINIGFFGCFIGYKFIFKRIISKGYSKKSIMIASIMASMISLECGSLFVVLDTLASGITRLPFTTFVLFMLPIHLIIGLVEGLVTGLVLNFVYENRPETLEKELSNVNNKVSKKKIIAIFITLAVIIGGGISLLASSNPDGLEWSIFQTTGSEELENINAAQDIAESIQSKVTLLPDYELNIKTDSKVIITTGKVISGIVGVAITTAVIVGIGYIIKKRKQEGYSSIKVNKNERS